MPVRNRRVRVSVREATETKSARGTPVASWDHVRYQTLLMLVPMSMDQRLRMDRAGFEADWQAEAWARPRLTDKHQLVWFRRNAQEVDAELVFRVKAVMPHGGRKVLLILKQEPERAKPDA